MPNQTQECQNCKRQFIIDDQDKAFYEKMQVPAPTFCPECRFQRRMMFRNERVLYNRTCDLCQKQIISVFASDKPYKVYCATCWWSDKWDGLEFGQDYDPSWPFFEQFQELQQKVPLMNLVVEAPSLINSDYTNHAGHLKDCYLLFDADFNEHCAYSTTIYHSKDSMELLLADSMELSYWDINCTRSFKTFFSEDCNDCHEVYFSKNCSGCTNCFGCINLKNKSYYIFNTPYTKEKYEKKIQEFQMDSFAALERNKKQAYDFWRGHPHKYMHGRKNTDVSGEYVYESKNAHGVYQVRGVENAKFCQRISMKPAKDVYDYSEWGNNAQLIYECITVGEQVNNMKFCFASWGNSMNMEYCIYCTSSNNLFGCIGLRKKSYCILNKQYSKEEYETLKAKIISGMKQQPYIDKSGRNWDYGEFFPYDRSFFGYNESTAAQYFPLTKEEAIAKGFSWKEKEARTYQITKRAEDIPDRISEAPDTITDEVIECTNCKKAFRIIKDELVFLREIGFSLPRKCADCRHQERLERMNPPKLWERACTKCGKSMKTSFGPERKEIVYCQACYLAEVA